MSTSPIVPSPNFGARDPDPRGYYGVFGGRFVPETLVAAIDKSSLLLVVVLSALILHEPLTWRSTIGALLMVGGILVISL